MRASRRLLSKISIILCLVLAFSLLNQASFASKKGLQGIESIGLSTKHTLYNLDVSQFISTEGGLGYDYLGSYTKDDETVVLYLDGKELTDINKWLEGRKNATGIETISMVILASELEGITDTTKSIAPYHAFDTWTEQGQELNRKLLGMIAECFAATVDYFIMQNEVNNPHTWMEMGKRSLTDQVTYYEKACRFMHEGIQAAGGIGKVMISMDYYWNSTDGGRLNGRKYLNKFAEIAKQGGDYDWGLVHHAYPCPLDDASFTDDASVGVKENVDTFVISISNFDILAEYMHRDNLLYEGEVRDIVIAESGFNAYSNGIIDEERQAAMYAYAYYLMEAQPEVKAFIIRAYVDLAPEPDMGLYFGMYDVAMHAREIKDVMTYVDTEYGSLVTQKYLKYLNAESWEEIVPNFETIKFEESRLVVGLDNDLGTNIGAGQIINWTAEAGGGTAPYQYRFVFINNNYEETIVSDYDESNTLHTALPLNGNAHMRVDVVDAEGKTASRTVWIRHDEKSDDEEFTNTMSEDTLNMTSQLISINADKKRFGRVGRIPGMKDD